MNLSKFVFEMKKRKLDAAIFYNLETGKENPTLRYLANYPGYGFLVIPKSQKPFLIIPSLDIEYAKKSGMKFYMWKKSAFDMIKSKLGKLKTVCIEEKKFSIFTKKQLMKRFKNLKLKDVAEIVDDLRKIKTSEEMKTIKKAVKMTDNLMQECIRNFLKFKSEIDAVNFMKKRMIDLNAEPSFELIVASGKNPASPHHIPDNKPLKKGFCVIDIGIRYKGYCTDMTRTIYLGKPSQKEIELYNLVLDVQEKAIADCTLKSTFEQVEKNSRKNLGKYSKYFIHSLGHSLGIEIHEKLDFKKKFEKKMLFTIEPGIYIPNKLGIRIEDMILMQEKPVVLTKTTKELIIVDH